MSNAVQLAAASAASSADGVRLTGVREQPLSIDEVVQAVTRPGAGGVCVFLGVVREQDADREVRALDYTAHPRADQVLHDVAVQVVAAHPGTQVAAVHRTGHLQVGDLAVVVAASAQHRQASFAACRDLIDTLKTTVPIWKHQLFADGTDEWVGSP